MIGHLRDRRLELGAYVRADRLDLAVDLAREITELLIDRVGLRFHRVEDLRRLILAELTELSILPLAASAAL